MFHLKSYRKMPARFLSDSEDDKYK
jgi:hypothetical protein